MNNLTIKLIATSATSALTIATAASAFAQEEEGASESNMIIVTARKVEERLQDIPGAITAFNAEELQNRSISELEDVALQTPGLVFEDFSNGGFGTPTIRGATQFSITSLEQNVSVFLDGIYIPRGYAFDVGSMNLERIEVVKGPQSALYGANAFMGAINYVSTSRSLTEISASAELEVSENGGLDLSGKISAPLVEDVLSMRLALGYSEFDGDFTNNHPDADAGLDPGTSGKIGGFEKSMVQVGASLKPVDALTIDFDYYNFKTDSETRAQYRLSRGAGDFNCSLGGAFGGFGVPDSNQLFCGELPSTPIAGASGTEGFVIDPRTYGLDSESSMVRVNVAAQLTDQISANYLYGHSEGDVFSAGGSDRDALVPTVFGGATGNAFTFNPVGDFKYDSHELRLQYSGDSGIYAMIGGFIQNGEDLELGTGGLVPFRDLTPLIAIPAGATPFSAFTETDTKAIFGRVAVPLLGERLTIEVEGRYTDEEKVLTDLSVNSPYTYSDSYFTPRASIDYKITDDNLVYVSIARGVKSGGINSTNGDLLDDERFYDPDTNWTYEIGLKNSFMGGRGTLNLAAFYIDWSNLQLQVAAEGATFFSPNIVQSIGGASSKGVEVEGTFEVIDGLVVNAGLAYIDATYDDDVISARITRSNLCGDGTVCSTDGSIGGNDLQRSSKLQWNVGASFDTGITSDIDFFSRLDVAGQSKQYVSEINVATIEPRTLVNGRLGVRSDNWSLSVWGKNLFDKKYVSNAFFIATPFFTDYVPTVGNRRRLGATLTFDY
ncbi:MAG: TonB-dependent receptor [Parasphingorhabdus sp.]|uniref:TonB-dependent receptor n=1 Tax=Parasphingorhabdus sp. TaxID=2709688 RepID=UPI00329933FA